MKSNQVELLMDLAEHLEFVELMNSHRITSDRSSKDSLKLDKLSIPNQEIQSLLLFLLTMDLEMK
jgi:hypothetical protein